MKFTMNACAFAVALSILPTLAAQQLLVLNGSNQLATINAATPGAPSAPIAITGLQPGETLVGMDIRPATGQLYALGTTNRLYVVDRTTGVAAAVAPSIGTTLSGERFGFDFNPTVDRIRVVSNTGQNLRLHPDLGTVVFTDPSLAYALTDVNAGAIANVAGAAYTNSFAGATVTTLYDIDTGLDILTTQNPANAGTLNTVGALGFNAGDVGGFDIDPATGGAFAAMASTANQNGASSLFAINLTSGAATFLGTIGIAGPIRGMIVNTAVNLPQVPAETIVCLTNSGTLALIDSKVPGAVFRSVGVNGLQTGETLVGIDFRPSNRQLYGVGDTGRIYTIHPATGVATQVGSQFSVALSGTRFGVDFNPVVDLLRVVSDANQNLRVNPTTGIVVGNDAALAFAATDANFGTDPNIGGAGYSNNFAGTTSTTLYDIDFVLDALVTQIPANAGTLQTVGNLGVDASGVAGFDISGQTGAAYAALTTSGSGVTASELFRINLATGQATFIGTIGLPDQIRGFTILPAVGATTFGTSTEGCTGPLPVGADSSPRLGNAEFSVLVANAPIANFGLLLFSDQMTAPGTVILGAKILVDVGSSLGGFFFVPTDLAGSSATTFAIPNDPMLIGAQGFVQFAFFDACAPGMFSASNGLSIVIQP